MLSIVGPPAAPDYLNAEWDSVIPNRINLHWHNTSNNEAGFKIYRSKNGGAPVLIKQRGSDETSWSDTLTDVSQGYAYTVCAFNDAGNSPMSPLASVKRAYTADELATVIYGETGSLRPQFKPGSTTDYDPASADNLARARESLGHAAMNKAKHNGVFVGVAHEKPTDDQLKKNPNTAKVWKLCQTAAEAVVAAQNAGNDPTGGARHYYLRKGPITWIPDPTSSNWWQQKVPDFSFGPLRDVLTGSKEFWIDIYKGIAG
jgi:hypothetical protein